MATFQNPNSPVQPQKGVYGWYAQKGRDEPIAIYIGNAGEKESFLPKGTLFRGVSELQRNTFTSNSSTSRYSTLDTDFIVGTAILYFEKNGYSCVWKHISNEASSEERHVKEQKPILQNSTGGKKIANIRDEYRLKKNEKDFWKNRKNRDGVSEAEKGIFTLLGRELGNS